MFWLTPTLFWFKNCSVVFFFARAFLYNFFLVTFVDWLIVYQSVKTSLFWLNKIWLDVNAVTLSQEYSK